jgi:hypothetical protein
MTSWTVSSIGMIELGNAIRPSVAKIAVSASRSGMRAAVSEPNTNSRMISVSGIESRPAFASMPLNAASVAFVVLTLPSSST